MDPGTWIQCPKSPSPWIPRHCIHGTGSKALGLKPVALSVRKISAIASMGKKKAPDRVCCACRSLHVVKADEKIGQCGGVVGPAKTPCMTNSCMMGRVYNPDPRARPIWLCLRCAEHAGWPTDVRGDGGEGASEEASQGGSQPAHNKQQKKQGEKKKNGGSHTDSDQRANLSSSMQTWLTASSVHACPNNMSTASSRQPRIAYYGGSAGMNMTGKARMLGPEDGSDTPQVSGTPSTSGTMAQIFRERGVSNMLNLVFRACCARREACEV